MADEGKALCLSVEVGRHETVGIRCREKGQEYSMLVQIKV